MFVRVGAVAAVVFAILAIGGGTAQAAVSCPTTPTYDPAVPTPQAVLGFPLGLGQADPVTSAQIVQYVEAVDDASDRVISFDAGETWAGRPLKVAIVSSREHMRANELRRIRERFVAVRDGHRESLRGSPAIVWLAGNVHGGEKSGADAELKVLYELAARTDCAARKLNDDLVTVIMPSQNPDGREASRRQNDYGFDLNRDWFARTQPETEAKVEVLRRWPGQVFVDAHEMGGRKYFFPPNADPIHHEIADEPVSWINGIGEANKAAFGYNGACSDTVTEECYFNYDVYDLFFMGYGDTVPATGFGAAGMTYEKGSASPTELRVDQQFRTHWATINWASQNRREVLDGWARIWPQAQSEGEQGVLQPNEVVQPENEVQFPVPDIRIRSYFLLPDRQLGDSRKLVERLRRMDVDVYRLKKSLRLSSARIFGGRSASGVRVPAGAYWIPMDQPQKHWIQATLGEDPYVPFPYFYDVSSWSNPLLMGVPTIYSGDRVRPSAERVRGFEGGVQRGGHHTRSYEYALDSSQAGALTFRLLDRGVELRRDAERNVVSLPADDAPRNLDRLAEELGIDVRKSERRARGAEVPQRSLGLLAGAGVSTTSGSYGEARYVIEQRWQRTAATVTAADVNANSAAFRDLGALIVPDGSSATGGLDAAGQQNLRDWVAAGGVLVGIRRAHRVARSAGLTSTTEKEAPDGYLVLGSHFRVDVDHASPVALGRPREDFQFNNDDPLLNPSTTGVNVLTYPSDDRFWFNGYTENADALKGTVALTDEPFGDGHVVLFANNPLFRAYEESGEHLVANALLYPEAGAALKTLRSESQDGASAAAQAKIRRAEAQAPPRDLGGSWRAIRIAVSEAQSDAALAVVRRYAEPAAVEHSRGTVTIVLANPEGLQADQHPFARELLQSLRSQGVRLRAAVL
jgi:hypothetical protein